MPPDALIARLGQQIKCFALQASSAVVLLLHWPSKTVPLAETIEALNAVKDAGQTRHIGVNNFTTAMIDEAVELSATPLVTNQVEYHPFLSQAKVMASLQQHGMALTAYGPWRAARWWAIRP